MGNRVPDSRTIWLFQENLTQKNLEENLFEQFRQFLYDLGLYVNEGKIVDASFVEVPKQRNKKEENEKIKAEKVRICGMINPKRNVKKILMPVGHKKADKNISDTKTMQKLIQRVN